MVLGAHILKDNNLKNLNVEPRNAGPYQLVSKTKRNETTLSYSYIFHIV